MPKILDPVADHERHFSSLAFGSLWATWGFSAAAILVGVRLTAPPRLGGFGLSLGQVALVAPPSVIVAVLMLVGVALVSFESGLPTGMLLRPAFGVAGSWVLTVAVALGYIAWMGYELKLIGRLFAEALIPSGLSASSDVLAIAAAVVVGAMSYLGLQRFAARLVRPVLVWGSILMFGGLLLWISNRGLVVSGARASGGALLLASQHIILYVLVFFPLVADTGRFAEQSNFAISGTGFGFGVATAGSIFAGALLGLAGGVGSIFSTGSLAMAAAVIAWLLIAELAQPFGFQYGASNAAGTLFLRRPPVFLGWLIVAAGVLLALVLTDRDLVGTADVLAFALAPAFAVMVVDYWVIRERNYLVDEMYDRTGMYGGVNPLGFVAYVIGLFVGLLIDPVGPDVFVDGLTRVVPFAGSWSQVAPGVLSAMAVSALLYLALGRIRRQDEAVVSPIRL